jgi:hypothetical protein
MVEYGMRKLAVILLLAVAIGGVYYNALSNGFVFDDYLLVVEHAAIPRVASDPLLAFSPAVVGYRPLRTLSYVLDYRLGGMHPWIFHLSNLVYHWVAACLVFLVTLRLVANEKVASCQLPVASLSDSGLRTPDCERPYSRPCCGLCTQSRLMPSPISPAAGTS